VADNPVFTLTRLLGGVVLMQGRLGHQVLGQMLVAGSSEVALAGASVVVAASQRQRNAVQQVAIRVAAPALAVRGILRKQEQRVERKAAIVDERERKLESRDAALSRREAALEARRNAVDATRAEEIAALQGERADLQAELERLSDRLRSAETPKVKSAPRKRKATQPRRKRRQK
jgi:chromosome segregation ATPase